MVKVSIIIPVYNVSEYLEQCLDSVVNQTIKETEIIIVNDGSTDNSEEICRKYADADSRVRLITQENQGLAAARQTGLDVATGEYIGFVDSDDWLELNMYEKMYLAAHDNDADIVFCNVFRNEDKKEQKYFESGYYDRKRMEEIIFPRLLFGMDDNGGENTIRWCNWLRLYKKKLIDDNQIRFDKRFRRCQDLPFTFECTIHANSYFYLGDDYLYHNRMNYESLSKGYTKDMWMLIKPLVVYLKDIVNNYHEYDFNGQLCNRASLFVFECCENENKPNNKKDYSQRINTIREIMNDRDARSWVAGLQTKNMRKINIAYKYLFKFRLANLFFTIAERRYADRKKDYMRKQSTNE